MMVIVTTYMMAIVTTYMTATVYRPPVLNSLHLISLHSWPAPAPRHYHFYQCSALPATQVTSSPGAAALHAPVMR